MAAADILAASGTGFALGATLIIAIGAQNAFVLRQGLRQEHVGLVVAFCAAADALLMTAGVLGAGRALAAAPAMARWMAALGALFLACYGLRALYRAWRPAALLAGHEGAMHWRSALAQAAAFTWLNPHVYLDTLMLVGAVGAQQAPVLRPAFLLGACSASILWFSALGYGARHLAPLFARPSAWRWLDTLIGSTMLLLAAMLVRHALT